MSEFSLSGKLLILRYSRLGRIPPALYGAQILAENGLPVLVVEYGERREAQTTVSGKPPRLRLESPWCAWVPAPARSALLLFGTLLQLLRRGRRGKPRLVLAHGIHEQTIAWLLKKLTGVPYAVHVHEIYDENGSTGLTRWLLKAEGPALRGAELLIFPEATRLQIYGKRYQLACPLFLVYNCPRRLPRIVPRDLRKAFHLPSECFVVGYVGGVAAENVIEEAVDALSEAPETYFILWGWASKAFERGLRERAEAAGVGERLIFAGLLQGDKWESLAGLDLAYCVYRPVDQRREHQATASNKLMEALAVGVPVLTSGQPDFASFVHSHGVGRFLPALTAGAIARAWVEMAANLAGRKAWGQNGRKAHERDLNYEAQFNEVLKEMLHRFKSD